MQYNKKESICISIKMTQTIQLTNEQFEVLKNQQDMESVKSTESTSKPLKHFRAGGITISQWETFINDKPLSSFSIQRSYKDKEDKWQNTNFFRVHDLPKLIELLRDAYREGIGLENGNNESK